MWKTITIIWGSWGVILMRWSCVAFDLDNTLLDYESAFKKTVLHSYEYLFKHRWNDRQPVDVNKWYQAFKRYCDSLYPAGTVNSETKINYRRERFIKAMNDFGYRGTEEMADQFQEYFYLHIHEFVEPFSGVHSLLKKLVEEQISVGIITNGKTEVQRKKISSIGIDGLVEDDAIFISEECGTEKPDQKIFHIAKQALCPKNNEKPPLYIGDSWELDIEGGRKAGWDVIYLNSCHQNPASTYQPFGVCDNFLEVKAKILTHISSS